MPSGPGGRLQSYGLGAALVVAVVLVLLLRPTSGPDRPGPGDDTGAGDASSTAPAAHPAGPPARATEEDFCAGFARLADSQAAFAGDGASGAAALEESARALVETGVPDSMSLPARSGYFTVVRGVHETIGLELAHTAVGAPPTPADGGDAAFSAYLGQHCRG